MNNKKNKLRKNLRRGYWGQRYFKCGRQKYLAISLYLYQLNKGELMEKQFYLNI